MESVSWLRADDGYTWAPAGMGKSLGHLPLLERLANAKMNKYMYAMRELSYESMRGKAQIAARWVDGYPGPIVLRLWTKVHLVVLKVLAMHCCLQRRVPIAIAYCMLKIFAIKSQNGETKI